MSSDPAHAGPAQAGDEEELAARTRAAYEAELNRISSAEMMLQAAVSLLNIGARRLGPLGAGAGEGAGDPAAAGAEQGSQQDLEQVRDAIDGVRALLDILERRVPQELAPLRDALSQLQLAYARQAQPTPGDAPRGGPAPSPPGKGDGQAAPGAASGQEGSPADEEPGDGPGPAESSGRLWVPGR